MANYIRDDFDFKKYMDLTDCKHNIRKMEDYIDEVIDWFHGDQSAKGAYLPWEKTHEKIRFIPGTLTVWSGENGSGKSEILGQCVISWQAQGERTLIISPEMKPKITIERMVRQAWGGTPPPPEFIKKFAGWSDDIYLYDQHGRVQVKKILAVIRYFAEELGGTHVVIDSLLKLGLRIDDHEGQNNLVNDLTVLAHDTDMCLHLVAHSRKPAAGQTGAGKFEVRGSGAITDQADMVITVNRNKKHEERVRVGEAEHLDEPSTFLRVDKNRHMQWEGVIALWLHHASHQWTETKNNRPVDLMRFPHIPVGYSKASAW